MRRPSSEPVRVVVSLAALVAIVLPWPGSSGEATSEETLSGEALSGAPVSDAAVAAAGSADRLGTSRLFFTARERGSADDDPGAAGDRIRSLPAEAGAPPDGAAVAGRPGGIVAVVAGHDAAAPARRMRFEALLSVAGRVSVVVDGRPCRTGDDGSELRCGVLPEGVRALGIDPDGRRLLVTLLDGRRLRLAVGDSVRR